VHEIQSNGRKSMRRGTLRRGALVPAAAIAVLAFAAPAHAGKPVRPPAATPPPAPVTPVPESVPTVPEAVSTVPETTDTEVPEMGVAPGASAPPVAEPAQPAEVEGPVEVTVPKPAVQQPKEPANAGSWVRVRTVRPRSVVRHSEPQHTAISPPRPTTHVQAPVARRHAHEPARHAARASTGRWYQVPAAQYRRSADRIATSGSKSPPVRAETGSATDRHAPSHASLHVRGKPPDGTMNCVRKGIECGDSCADNADWKVVWNGRPISGCTSPNDTEYSPDEGQNSERTGRRDRGGSPSSSESGPQYQCPGTQYHDYWCDEGVSDSPDVDDETGVDTETPDDEPASSCTDSGVPVDTDHDEDDSDADVGGWDKPHDSSCDESSEMPITPGGTPPPTGKQGTPAQPPLPPAPPAPPEPAQMPPPPPPTEEPVAPPPTEQPSAPPPDQPPPTGANAPPPAEPAPTPSVPAADEVPKNTRGARTGTRRESHNPARAFDRPVTVIQPSSHVVLQAAPKPTAAPVAKKPGASKPRATKKQERRQARPRSSATRPRTDRSALQPPRATRPVPSTSQQSRDWLLLLAMTLFGLSVLAFALAAVSEVDGGTTALTRMRSRLGSKGLSPRRVGLNGGNDEAASSQPPDAIRYRD
jgi:hypothetical protein